MTIEELASKRADALSVAILYNVPVQEFDEDGNCLHIFRHNEKDELGWSAVCDHCGASAGEPDFDVDMDMGWKERDEQ